MTPAEMLREAAQHIEKVGLNQDGGLFKGYAVTSYQSPEAETTPCCVMGALALVNYRHSDLGMTTYSDATAALYLDPRIEGSVASWNDRRSTTQADAVDLLRVSADRIEQLA